MLIALLLVAATPAPASAEPGPCALKMLDVVKAPECSAELQRDVAEDLDLYLKDGKSLIGDLITVLDKSGKLPAVIERANRVRSFQAADGYRGTKWGMTAKQVRTLFPKGRSDGTRWVIADPVAGYPAVTAFEFVGDRLVEASAYVARDYENQNRYLDDFAALKALLTEKYGKPEVDETNWSQTLYKDTPEHWGTAVAVGHLSLGAAWTTKDTRVMIACRGNNGKVAVGIVYDSIALSDLRAETEKTKALRDL